MLGVCTFWPKEGNFVGDSKESVSCYSFGHVYQQNKSYSFSWKLQEGDIIRLETDVVNGSVQMYLNG